MEILLFILGLFITFGFALMLIYSHKDEKELNDTLKSAENLEGQLKENRELARKNEPRNPELVRKIKKKIDSIKSDVKSELDMGLYYYSHKLILGEIDCRETKSMRRIEGTSYYVLVQETKMELGYLDSQEIYKYLDERYQKQVEKIKKQKERKALKYLVGPPTK